MHIALLTDGIQPYVVGGMQRHSFYLAKYLAAAGHQVDLYHTNQSELDISRLEVFTEEEKTNIQSFVIEFPKFGTSPGHYIRESFEYSLRIWNKFKSQRRPDFIYVKGFSGWALLNEKKKGEKLPPIGLNFHGYEMFQPAATIMEWMKYALLLRSPVKFCVAQADFLFSYGGKITSIIEGLGVAGKRIIEIPTGIGTEWINDSSLAVHKTRKFVFVGRNERRKGISELNDSISNLTVTQSENSEFHFIGPIADKKKLKRENVIYHGEQKDSEKIRLLLRSCDVLVCPSHSEGMPNVILEGMASACAIIATDVGAVSLLVDDSNGYLIKSGDRGELLAALVKAIEIPDEKLLILKRTSVSKVKRFLWSDVVIQTIEKINSIVSSTSNE